MAEPPNSGGAPGGPPPAGAPASAAPAAPPAHGPGGHLEAEQRRRGIEIGTHFKKLLDVHRIYEGHQALESIEGVLWEKVHGYLEQFGDLAIELSAEAVSIEGKNVITAARAEDSISYPLFAEGVHEILIGHGLSREELLKFVRIWAEGFKSHGGESVLASFWEADFQNVELVAMAADSFGDNDDKGSERRRELARVMKSVVGQLPDFGGKEDRRPVDASFMGEVTADEASPHQGPRLLVDDPTAVALLSAEINVALAPDNVTRPPAPRSSPASPEILQAMREAVEQAWSEGIAIRFIYAIFAVAFEANDDERAILLAPLSRVFAALAEARRFADLAGSLERAHALAGADPRDSARRFAIVERVLAAVAAPEVLGHTMDALEDPATAEAAAVVLQAVPASRADALLPGLERQRSRAAMERLAGIIARKKPSATALAEQARTARPEVARMILRMVEGRPADEAAMVRHAVLNHPNPVLRRVVVETLTAEDVRANAAEIQHLFADQDARVRDHAMLLCVQAQDRSAVPVLSAMLFNKDAPPEALLHAATALGRLGGVEAGIVLRKAFLTLRDVDVRAVCAIALGEMGDRAAKPLLEKETTGLLKSAKLKAACLEALRRLNARQTTLPPPGGRER